MAVLNSTIINGTLTLTESGTIASGIVTVPTGGAIYNALVKYQPILTAGTGISIANNVISLSAAIQSTIAGKADKATTLAGYGITDAKIENGTITLGTNTITPITSHQDISGKQDKITSTNKLSASLVSGLATVATSGNYNDLSNKPTIDNNNQKVQVTNGTTTTTFGANDSVSLVAGSNVTITPDTTNKKITIASTNTTITTPPTISITLSTAPTRHYYANESIDSVTANVSYTGWNDNDMLRFSDTGWTQFFNKGNTFNGCTGVTDLSMIPYDATKDLTYTGIMFSNCTSLKTFPLLNTSKITNMDTMCNGCTSLTDIPLFDTSNVTNFGGVFNNCSSLKAIPAFDLSQNTTNMSWTFTGCSSLETFDAYGMKVSFNLSSSTKLTANEMVKIFRNLATVTTTQTLTLGSTNLAKLTDTQKAIAINKGWTLA